MWELATNMQDEGCVFGTSSSSKGEGFRRKEEESFQIPSVPSRQKMVAVVGYQFSRKAT